MSGNILITKLHSHRVFAPRIKSHQLSNLMTVDVIDFGTLCCCVQPEVVPCSQYKLY